MYLWFCYRVLFKNLPITLPSQIYSGCALTVYCKMPTGCIGIVLTDPCYWRIYRSPFNAPMIFCQQYYCVVGLPMSIHFSHSFTDCFSVFSFFILVRCSTIYFPVSIFPSALYCFANLPNRIIWL